MTILFFLKPYWYSFPPSPGEVQKKRDRKAYRKRLFEERKRRLKDEMELLIMIIQGLI